jgi:hypothetical protein
MVSPQVLRRILTGSVDEQHVRSAMVVWASRELRRALRELGYPIDALSV